MGDLIRKKLLLIRRRRDNARKDHSLGDTGSGGGGGSLAGVLPVGGGVSKECIQKNFSELR